MTDDELDNRNIDYPFEDTGGSGDENRIRGNWSSKTDYFLSVFGFTFALGNLWRFPYQLAIHGGVAYLIPYTVVFFLTALPILSMELALGQFISLGPIAIWKMTPLFKGIGISMVFIACILAIYYNMITAWALFYVVNSLKFTIPWASCGHSWNTAKCSVWNRGAAELCRLMSGFVLANGSCAIPAATVGADHYQPHKRIGVIVPQPLNSSASSNLSANLSTLTTATTTTAPGLVSEVPLNRVMPSLEYFHRHVLMISSDILEFQTVNWQIAICLFVAWILIFVCSFKGIKTSGKVVYFTAVLPYIIIFVLFVRLVTLPGSIDGVLHFLKPNWAVLRDLRVWGDAAVQVFYSLSMCTGGLATLASFNRFHNNVFLDVWLVALVDFLTSICVSALVFSAIGFVCYEMDTALTQFKMQDGVQLIFVFFAEALSKLPVAQIYALLFFGMVALIIFNSELFLVETIVSSICDEFPERLRRNHRHVLVFVLLAFYILGIPLCTSAGIYWILLLEKFTATWPLLIIAFFEIMVVCWIYGSDNYMDNVKWMIRFYPPLYIAWRILFKCVCPLVFLTVLAFVWVEYRPLSYDSVMLPQWATIVGWTISLSPLAIITVSGFYKFFTTPGTFTKKWGDLLCPEDDWGPALAVHRAEVYPMQIPEARKLMISRSYQDANGSVSRDDGTFIAAGGGGTVKFGTYKNPAFESGKDGSALANYQNGNSRNRYAKAMASERETII